MYGAGGMNPYGMGAVGAGGPWDPNDPHGPPQPPSAWQAMLHAISGGGVGALGESVGSELAASGRRERGSAAVALVSPPCTRHTADLPPRCSAPPPPPLLPGVVHFFGRLSFLVDENAHAVHFFISALLQLLDRCAAAAVPLRCVVMHACVRVAGCGACVRVCLLVLLAYLPTHPPVHPLRPPCAAPPQVWVAVWRARALCAAPAWIPAARQAASKAGRRAL